VEWFELVESAEQNDESLLSLFVRSISHAFGREGSLFSARTV
jgi:hypothetical protein